MSTIEKEHGTGADECKDRPLTGEEIVISGIAGIFPSSDNVSEFMDNLYNKVDMVTKNDTFGNIENPEIPQHSGKVKGLSKFDAQFFRVTYWQAKSLDASSRKLMELAFSAIFDSGVNPVTLNGSKLGVFVGAATDGSALKLYDEYIHNTFIITGCSKSMIANRISYWINAKGPSYTIESASIGSMTCLELAYRSIKSGECDAAIVGGVNLYYHPGLILNFKRSGYLCSDGKTKCFDKNGDGYVRSEALSVLFLQKAKDAKRIYSEIYSVKGKYFTRPDSKFSLTRDSKDLEIFFKEFYSDTELSPNDVEYVETNGSGIAEADGNELEAIGNVFGQEHPVSVGSVASNMGNSEAAAGLCAVTKVCLAFKKGKLPPNLHYYEPQDHISAVRDGKVQVLTEQTPFKKNFAAVNNFSFTGNNYHVLLKGHYKAKKKDNKKNTIPHLVLVSGRQEESVNKMLNILKNSPVDPEQIALLHNIYKDNIPSHTGRGYTVLSKSHFVC